MDFNSSSAYYLKRRRQYKTMLLADIHDKYGSKIQADTFYVQCPEWLLDAEIKLDEEDYLSPRVGYLANVVAKKYRDEIQNGCSIRMVCSKVNPAHWEVIIINEQTLENVKGSFYQGDKIQKAWYDAIKMAYGSEAEKGTYYF